MNKVIFYSSLLLLGVFEVTLGGCFKHSDKPLLEEDKLPPATQEGKKTFGCLVNGKAWEPSLSFYPTLQSSFGFQKDTNGIVLSSFFGSGAIKQIGDKVESTHLSLSRQNELISTGNYVLNPGEASFTDEKATCADIYGFRNIDGFVEITRLDTIFHIISGTFEFNAFHPNCPDTIRVTKGRFDVTY